MSFRLYCTIIMVAKYVGTSGKRVSSDARAAVLCGFSANSRYGKARQKIRKTGP